MRKFIRKISNKLSIIKKSFFNRFDFQDFLSLVGLSMIFYGFYMYKPMSAYIIVGFIVLYISAGSENKDKG